MNLIFRFGISSGVKAVSAGWYWNLALLTNGTVVDWGFFAPILGQDQRVPADLTNATAIACGAYHCLAVRGDGTVESWGYNESGQTNVPTGLSNVVAVVGGSRVVYLGFPFETILSSDVRSAYMADVLLADGRADNPGAPSKLTAAAKTELAAGLRTGDWRTVPQLRAWLQTKHNITMTLSGLYNHLGKIGTRRRVPRPSHVKKDPAAAAQFRETLPAYSPELNPVEGLWDQLKDALCNRVFASLTELEAVMEDWLGRFWRDARRVRSLVFDWLLASANASSRIILPVISGRWYQQ